MTRPYRLLGGEATPAGTSPGDGPSPSGSDFVLILAALLCALICALGLVAVARCACLRRHARQSPTDPKANRGLKKKVLRSIPKLTIPPESAAGFSDCAICLAELSVGDEIRVLPQCGHSFHVACVDTWLRSHSSCPSCRQILGAPAAVGRCGCDKCGGTVSVASTSGTAGGAEASSAAEETERRDVGGNKFLP